MPESKDLQLKIDEILSDVRSMAGLMPWLVKAQEKELKPLYMELFKKRKRLAKVYLATNGQRSVSDIATYLSLHEQAVTNESTDLRSMGLTEQKRWGIYKRTQIDSILGLSRDLRKIPEFATIE